MATFQVCQPTGWTGMVVAWAVVRSLAEFPDADPTGGAYLGGVCLPSLARFVIGTALYVDNHALPLCGLARIGRGVLLISDGDGKATTDHEGQRAGAAGRMSYCGQTAMADSVLTSAGLALRL